MKMKLQLLVLTLLYALTSQAYLIEKTQLENYLTKIRKIKVEVAELESSLEFVLAQQEVQEDEADSAISSETSPSEATSDSASETTSDSTSDNTPINNDKFIIGYWENWKIPLPGKEGPGSGSDASYYAPSIEHYTHVLYSFLTLSKSPNPWNPPNEEWDGTAIYETMTLAPVLTVMNDTTYTYTWQAVKIKALIKAAHDAGKKFIWAIGGWSDIQKTIRPDQIDLFVSKCVDLLREYGDGIDFDWEHLSQLANGGVNPDKHNQLNTLADTMKKLREELDKAGLADKSIGYTTRFNAFMENSTAYGFKGFQSDGEGIAINNRLKAQGTSLNDIVDWVNIMAYDVSPSEMPNGKTWNMPVYKDVISTFTDHVRPDLVVLGFEPGGQPAGGVWEGLEVDKEAIQYIDDNGLGGSMFWAINQPALGQSSEITGLNAHLLAHHSLQLFSQ